ncbi:MAG: hypothetical protein Q4C49_08790 [Bacillota bacterium]|nr:hypothetical protein [Bacillota bacterium]
MKKWIVALGLACSLSLGVSSNVVFAQETIVQENAPSTIISQPKNFVGNTGSTATFSVKAENVSKYLWQYSADNGKTWDVASSFNGYKTDTVSFGITAYRMSLLYRCILTSPTGDVISSDVVYVKSSQTGERATITAHPVNFKGNDGETGYFSVSAQNASGYIWYYSPDNGANWYIANNFAGYQTNKCTFTISSYRKSLMYRCKVISTDGSMVFSNAAYIYSNEGGTRAKITAHPQDYSGDIGSTVSFSVSAENAAAYVWQYSTDNKVSWNNATTLSGYNTPTCTFTLNNYRAGLVYRCKVISSDGSVLFSNPAYIHANVPAVVISQQPVDYTGAIGDPATFSVQASNVSSYLWQYSQDGGQNWYTASSFEGYTTRKISFTVNNYRSTLSFRCKITGLDGKVTYTDAVKFIKGGSATILSQPTNVTGLIGDSVTFTVKAENVDSYTWYYSPDNGASWYTASSFAGYNTNSVSFTSTSYRASLLYKCKLTGNDKRVIYTDVVRFVLHEPAKIVSEPEDYYGLDGENVSFTVVAENAKSYVWQYSNDGGTNWYTASSFAGYNTDTLSFSMTSYRRSIPYRCKVVGKDGKEVYSKVVRCYQVAHITTQPQETKVKVGSTATFAVSATGDDLSYAWEVSQDGGKTWKSANNTTSKLEVVTTVDMTDNLYRCVVTDKYGYSDVSNSARLIVLLDKNPGEDETEILSLKKPEQAPQEEVVVEEEAITEEIVEEE